MPDTEYKPIPVYAKVRYASHDDAIPSDWKGRILSREKNIGDSHHYMVRWYKPNGEYHDGLYHVSDIEVLP